MSYINNNISFPIDLNKVYENIEQDLKKAIDLSIACQIYKLHINIDKKLREGSGYKKGSARDSFFQNRANTYLNHERKTLFESIVNFKSVFIEIGNNKESAEILLIDSPDQEINTFILEDLNNQIETRFWSINRFINNVNILFPDIQNNIIIDLKNYKKYVNDICDKYNIESVIELIDNDMPFFNLEFEKKTNHLMDLCFIEIANKYGVDIKLYLNDDSEENYKIDNIKNFEKIKEDILFKEMIRLYKSDFIIIDEYSISSIIQRKPELSKLVSGKEEFDILKEKEEINKSLNEILNKFKIKK